MKLFRADNIPDSRIVLQNLGDTFVELAQAAAGVRHGKMLLRLAKKIEVIFGDQFDHWLQVGRSKGCWIASPEPVMISHG